MRTQMARTFAAAVGFAAMLIAGDVQGATITPALNSGGWTNNAALDDSHPSVTGTVNLNTTDGRSDGSIQSNTPNENQQGGGGHFTSTQKQFDINAEAGENDGDDVLIAARVDFGGLGASETGSFNSATAEARVDLNSKTIYEEKAILNSDAGDAPRSINVPAFNGPADVLASGTIGDTLLINLVTDTNTTFGFNPDRGSLTTNAEVNGLQVVELDTAARPLPELKAGSGTGDLEINNNPFDVPQIFDFADPINLVGTVTDATFQREFVELFGKQYASPFTDVVDVTFILEVRDSDGNLIFSDETMEEHTFFGDSQIELEADLGPDEALELLKTGADYGEGVFDVRFFMTFNPEVTLGSGSFEVIPEPTSLAFVALSAAGLLLRRKRSAGA